MSKFNLLPAPRSLKRLPGHFTLPKPAPHSAIRSIRTGAAPNHTEGYALTIDQLAFNAG
jgi:hypothetical protein